MTTEISHQKHPVPLDQHATLVQRCLDAYNAAERRKRLWRFVLKVILAGITVTAAIFFYLLCQ